MSAMERPILLSPSTPRFPPRGHARTPSRSPTRPRIMDDILADLSPTTTLEAFMSVSGKLRASIEAASPTQRAFGIRAAIASKKIQEWIIELSGWPWPAGGSEGFEIPVAKRGRISDADPRHISTGDVVDSLHDGSTENSNFWGSLPAEDVMRYESRIDDIWEDMEDLNVEEIKRQILETHVLPRSRPSTPQGHSHNAPTTTPPFLSYTRIDDFTAVVTATVLQALPNLSRLNALMNVWSIRLAVLRQVPPLVLALDDAELALRSGWNAINITGPAETRSEYKSTSNTVDATITRDDFEIMRNHLQDRVTVLGQRLDHMLDALEGQEDTIPDAWLDRMEAIEQEYGEWAVCGDRKVREGEWSREAARQRRQEEKLKPTDAELVLLQSAVLGSQKFEPDEEQHSAPKIDQSSGTDRHLQEKNFGHRDESAPALPQFAIDSGAIGISNEKGFNSTDFPRRESPPPLPAQDNSGQRDAFPHPKEPMMSAEIENQVPDQGDDPIESSNIPNDENPILIQPICEDLGSHTSSDIENLTLPSSDLADKDSISVELVTDDSFDRNVALPREKEAYYPVIEPIQSLPNLGPGQLTAQPQPPISGFPPFDGALEDNKVIELHKTSQQPLDALSALELIDSTGFSSPGTHEGSPVELVAKADESVLLPPIQDEPDVTGDGSISDISFHPGDQVEDNTSRLVSPSSPILAAENGIRSLSLEPATSREIDRAVEHTTPPASRLSFTTLEAFDDDEAPLTPRTPSPASESSAVHAIRSPSNQPRNGYYVDDGGTPRSPSKVQRLSRHFANALKQTRPSNISSSPSISSSFASDQRPAESFGSAYFNSTPLRALLISEDIIPGQFTKVDAQKSPATNRPTMPLSNDVGQMSLSDASVLTPKLEYSVSTMPTIALLAEPSHTHFHFCEESSKGTEDVAHSQSRESSITEYSNSGHTRVLNDADECFPILPLVRGDGGNVDGLGVMGIIQISSSRSATSTPESTFILDTLISQSESQTSNPTLDNSVDPDLASTDSSEDVGITGNMAESDISEPFTPEQSITASQDTLESPIVSLKENVSPNTSTIIDGGLRHSVETPRAPSPGNAELPQPPLNDSTTSENIYEESPSFGLVRVYDDLGSYSPPSSPPSMPAISKRRQLQPISSTPYDPNALSPDSPLTPGELPLLLSVEVSPAPISSPPKVSADQFQQQISEILDTIPARIRLTSEPDSDQRSDIIQSRKRPSLGTGFRPMSRSSTPSFTLAPAYAKNPRPRAQNGHPEIKLYHLSRGTGEAPIKLFVRLVGEHGERVMVRVGGGWADLGEYLKEYASHHGRKSDKAGKVEIQDLPSRVVSVGSTHSVSTLRNSNGRSSPVSRPTSSLERPLSSLAVRKTRKSVGEDILGRGQRSPSTPQQYAMRSTPSVPRQSETPPSVISRPVSRLSWSEEESPLGLAGPTSKKVDIGAENAAWVESMKEKVRLASAEKKEKTTAAATDFGQLGKVGGTKRLFKKAGQT